MKKRLTAMFTGVLVSSLLFTGCQASKGLETDEVKITQYKEIEVDQVEKPSEVTDDEVENYIQTMLQTNADTKEITDRAVQNGDTATIDFVGKVDGEEFDGGSAEGYPLEIGSGAFIPGFEDSIIGHKTGETFDWNGQFPEDYGNADYAGKDVVFTITVNHISENVVPELSDEFVKSVSEESKTAEEYREEVKKLLTEQAEQNYKSQLNSAVWQKVLENTEVSKYPEDEVKELSEGTIEQYKSIADYMGMEYEDYLVQNGTTVEEFEKQVEDSAKENIKQTMAVKAIAKKEKLELSDEEYEKQLENIAKTYGYEDVDALKEAAEEEDLKEIALYNVVVEWLAENCIQKAS